MFYLKIPLPLPNFSLVLSISSLLQQVILFSGQYLITSLSDTFGSLSELSYNFIPKNSNNFTLHDFYS